MHYLSRPISFNSTRHVLLKHKARLLAPSTAVALEYFAGQYETNAVILEQY